MSNINTAVPSGPHSFTEDVRGNFAIAASEIDDTRANWLALSGGTMRGALALAADPVGDMEAVTRRYLNQVVGNQGPFLPLSGGLMGGSLRLYADPSLPDEAATRRYIDNAVARYLPLAGGAVTGSLSVAGALTAPTPAAASNDASVATTAFVKGNAGSYLPLSGGTLTGPLAGPSLTLTGAGTGLSVTNNASIGGIATVAGAASVGGTLNLGVAGAGGQLIQGVGTGNMRITPGGASSVINFTNSAAASYLQLSGAANTIDAFQQIRLLGMTNWSGTGNITAAALYFNSTLTGSISGLTQRAPIFLSAVNNVDSGGTLGLPTVYVGNNVNSAAARGSRFGVDVMTSQTGTTGNTIAVPATYVGGRIQASASANDGGTGTTLATVSGTVFGANLTGGLYSGATNFNATVGVEVDAFMQAGSSAMDKFGILIAETPQDGAQAARNDIAICLANQNTSAAGTNGWRTILGINKVGGSFPMDPTNGWVMQFTPDNTTGLCPGAGGIDFTNFAPTTAFIRGPGFLFNPSGNLTLSGAGTALSVTNNALISGTLTASAGANVGSATANGVGLAINGIAGTQRRVDFLTAGTLRWRLGETTDAETGGNAGSSFYLNAYNDAGGGALNAWNVNRPDALTTLTKLKVGAVGSTAGTKTFDGTAWGAQKDATLYHAYNYVGSTDHSAWVNYAYFTVPTDNADVGAGQQAIGLGAVQSFGGAQMTGGRTGIRWQLSQTAAVTQNAIYQAGLFTTDARYPAGGANLWDQTAGSLFGAGIYTGLNAGATNWRGTMGLEIDFGISAGATAGTMGALQLVKWGTHGYQPIVPERDFMMRLADQTGSAFGSSFGIIFGADGQWPIDINRGKLIGASFGPGTVPLQAMIGIDLLAVSFTNSVLRSQDFVVYGSGSQRIGSALISGPTSGPSIDASGQYVTGATVASGGGGLVVGYQLIHEATGTILTVSAVSGNAATAVTIYRRGWAASPPANPVTFRAMPSHAPADPQPTDPTINLTWTAVGSTLSLNPSGGPVAVGAGGIIQNGQNLITGQGSTGYLLIGDRAGQAQPANAVAGNENTLIGNFTGQYLTTGVHDTGCGLHTMGYELTGSFDSAFGNDAMRNTVGVSNGTAAGANAYRNYHGSNGTAVGYNALQGNGGTITITGTATAGDVLSVTITCAAVTGSPITVNSPVSAGQSLLTMATNLATAIANTPALMAANIGAYPSGVTPGVIGIDYNGSSTVGTALTMTANVTGAGTEVMAVTGGTTNAFSNNIAIGYFAMRGLSMTTASQNTAVGVNSLQGLTTGSQNIAMGESSGAALTSGSLNTYLGFGAARGPVSGSGMTGGSNTAIGAAAFQNGTTAANLTAVGNNAALNLTTGNNNTFVGQNSGLNITTGANNVGVGASAVRGAAGSGAVSNVGVGLNALLAVTGNGNVAIGGSAGAAVSSGGNNVIIGNAVGSVTLTTGGGNIYIGNGSAIDAATGAEANTFRLGGNATNLMRAFNIQSATPSFFLDWLPAMTSYANDAAAATGGVAVGQVYRNGSQVMVRVA